MTAGPMVIGLSCEFHVNGRCLQYVSGPALYAAIGAQYVGTQTTLNTSVPFNALNLFQGVCSSLGIDSSRVQGTDSKVEWIGPAVAGDDEVAQVVGDPSSIVNSFEIASWPGPIIIANTNPAEAIRWICKRGGGFTAIDLSYVWIRFLGRTCLDFVKHADLLTLTAKEAALLSSLGPIDLKHNAILVTKHGSNGVHVRGLEQEAWLPAPQVSHVLCDIGAGDLLLGSLSAAIAGFPPNERFKLLVDTYSQIEAIMCSLLESSDPDVFLDYLLAGFL